MYHRFLYLLFSTLYLLLPSPCRALTATDLKSEFQGTALAINSRHPRLSWILHSNIRGDRATAYHLLVATRLELLSSGKGDLWDVRLHNSDSINVEYMGKPLTSGMACYWKVQPVDKRGATGPWSTSACWEMGLLMPEDWKAKWIGDGKPNPTKDADFYKPDPAPLFRKEFKSNGAPVRARLAISGLGYYEARLNGKRIGDALLAPAWTNYAKRVSYTVYDVTKMLRAGANCLGVTLGNGWYNPLPLRMFGTFNLREALPIGRPRFIAQLELTYSNGSHQTILSDDTWSVTEGLFQFNNIYLGEIYDARKERTGWDRPGEGGAGWRSAALCDPPAGMLEAQPQPPIRVTLKLPTKTVTQPKPGVYIFDMGQNFAGLVRLKLSAPAGTEVVLRYGELLYKDGTLNPMTSVAGQIKGTRRLPHGTEESVGGPGAPPIAWQTDTYITSGKGEESYTPSFTFHGFRYVEVTGCPFPPKPEMLLGLRMNSDVERVGFFTCSNPVINRIQQMCDNTFLSNLFSVQSDCPHRERFGYGGDIAATCEAFMMNYDMSRFYAKVVRDFGDAARPDGMLTDTAPFVGIQYCGMAWAMAHPLLQRRLYQYYGDRQIIEEQYPISQRWLDLVDTQFPDHIVTNGLSDHESLAPVSTPVLLTPLYANAAKTVSELAEIAAQADQSRSVDAAKHEKNRARNASLAIQTVAAFQKQFVSKDGTVGNGTQAAQVTALENNAIPEAKREVAMRQLIRRIERNDNNHVSTGIFGTNYLLNVLSASQFQDFAFSLVTNDHGPGWKNMLDNGATTLWEHWQGSDNTYSQNHPMFGSVSQWICEWIGGIAPAKDAVGFDRVEIRPLIDDRLGFSAGRYRSIRGDIVCRWHRVEKREGNLIFVFTALDVVVPVGATAHMRLPPDPPYRHLNWIVKESGHSLKNAVGIRARPNQDGFDLESGDYHFTIPDHIQDKRGAPL